MHRTATPGNAALGTDPLEVEALAYTVPRAARLLDISDRKAWELVHNGTIESIKIGTSRRVTRAALLAYVESLRSAA